MPSGKGCRDSLISRVLHRHLTAAPSKRRASSFRMMWFTLSSHRYERGYSRRCRQLGGQRIGPSSATIGLLALPAAKPGVTRLDSPLRLTR